jgi:phytoene dehydrogenase-like protein
VSTTHDTIVIGAGPNGLATAALLARRGRKVVVLERRGAPGGLAASEEFHPGYRSAGVLHDTSGLRPTVVRELELERHGLRLRERGPDVLVLGDDGESLTLPGVGSGALETLSPRDAEAWARRRRFHEELRPVLATFVDEPAIDPTDPVSVGMLELVRRAFRLRRLGRERMHELLRLPPMCVGDAVAEWFESELLQAGLALPAVAGTWMGPRSPGSTLNLLLQEALAGPGIVGAGPALIRALAAAAREHGVELRFDAGVARVRVEGGRVSGVELAGGERLDAETVAASCDPKHLFLDLLPPKDVSATLDHRMRCFRTRGTTAQVLLALRRPLELAARPGERIEHARVAASPLAIERAFDAVKYGRVSERPVLEIHVPTVEDPDLAPADHEVVSLLVHYAPYELRSGWDDAARDELGRRALAELERVAPGTAASVVAQEVRTPLDLERRFGTRGGHLHHGEHALDQRLVRPVPECIHHATPIAGLYLCGSGSHPGGGLTCAPAALAARAILAA